MHYPKAGAPAPGKKSRKGGSEAVDVLMVLDLQGRIKSVRPPGGLSVLPSRGPWEGRLLSGVLPSPGSEKFDKALGAALESGVEQVVRFAAGKGGERGDVVLSLMPHCEENIVFASLKTAVAGPEVSERVLAGLQAAGEILENLADGVMIVARDMRLVYVNSEICRSLGYTREELLGQHIGEVEVDFGARGRGEIMPRIVSGERVTVRGAHRRKDGSTLPVEARMGMSVIGDERVVVITARDVTEKLREEEQLLFRDKALRTSSAGVATAGLNGILTYVNEAFLRMWGYRRETEVVGRSVVDFWVNPEEAAEVSRRLMAEGSFTGVLEAIRKDGSQFPARITSSHVKDDQGAIRGLLGWFSDVTEEMKVRRALEESEERFRVAFDNSPDCLVILHIPSRSIVDVNARFMELSGYRKDEVVGRTTKALGFWKDEAGRQSLYGAVASKGRADDLEADFIVRGGGVIRSLVTAVPVNLQGEPHFLVFVRDISAIKETESRLRTSLEEKEILLKEVYHRVKNNLQVVSGLLNLQAHMVDDRDVKQVFRESQNRVITMALIHEELYRARDLTRLDFHQYIRSLAENLVISYGVSPERVEVLMDLEEVGMVVDTAIPVGLVVNEILSNALKHAFPGTRKGLVRITLRSRGPSKFCLQIEDDGIGLPEDLDIMKTRSLGLRIVTMICEQLGGDLTVKSEGGTSFRLTFPEYYEAGTQLY